MELEQRFYNTYPDETHASDINRLGEYERIHSEHESSRLTIWNEELKSYLPKPQVSADHIEEKSFFAKMDEDITMQKNRPIQIVDADRMDELIMHRENLHYYLESAQERGFYISQTGPQEWTALDNHDGGIRCYPEYFKDEISAAASFVNAEFLEFNSPMSWEQFHLQVAAQAYQIEAEGVITHRAIEARALDALIHSDIKSNEDMLGTYLAADSQYHACDNLNGNAYSYRPGSKFEAVQWLDNRAELHRDIQKGLQITGDLPYRKVRDSIAIGRTVADLFEQLSHQPSFMSSTRPSLINYLSEALNEQSGAKAESIITELKKYPLAEKEPLFPSEGDKAIQAINEIRNYQRQLHMRDIPYEKPASDRAYDYGSYTYDQHSPKKAITQETYDQAAKDGFPKDFFANSYFDHVQFYCLPDNADFSNSLLSNCQINLCRSHNADFTSAIISDTDIHSSDLQNSKFLGANLYHTRIRDTNLDQTNFESVLMSNSQITSSKMNDTNFLLARLSNCSIGGVQANNVQHVKTMSIWGGGTTEEVAQNRNSILSALGQPTISQRIEKANLKLPSKEPEIKRSQLKPERGILHG